MWQSNKYIYRHINRCNKRQIKALLKALKVLKGREPDMSREVRRNNGEGDRIKETFKNRILNVKK